jgi:hypothetical protein
MKRKERAPGQLWRTRPRNKTDAACVALFSTDLYTLLERCSSWKGPACWTVRIGEETLEWTELEMSNDVLVSEAEG